MSETMYSRFKLKLFNLFLLGFMSSFLTQAKPLAAQTPVTLSPYQRQQFPDVNGKPLAGGCVFTYQGGTTTPLATYTDYTGTIQNPNPVILDSAGEAQIWISSASYRFVTFSSGGTNCASGVQQWTIDFVSPPPFASGNNTWTGTQTFGGATTFNAAAVFNGAMTLNGSIGGSPAFTGSPSFTGNPTFSNNQPFPGGITTDTINGSSLVGATLAITGSSYAGATGGETVYVAGGAGGAGGGAGGALQLGTGSPVTGNNFGGQFINNTGNGSGNSHGGDYTFFGGTGGATAGRGGSWLVTGGTGGPGGNGGDMSIFPGAAGAGGQDGSFVLGNSGRLKFAAPATADAPTCGSTGIGGSGTCTLGNYSTDTSGKIFLNAAAGAAATGLATLTFHQTMGPNGSFCMFMPVDGSGVWTAPAVIQGDSGGSGTATFTWTNGGAVALTAASNYAVMYWCRGEN